MRHVFVLSSLLFAAAASAQSAPGNKCIQSGTYSGSSDDGRGTLTVHCLASSNCCIREYTTTPHKMDILNASGQVVATYTYGTTSSSPDGSGGTNAKFTDAKKVQ